MECLSLPRQEAINTRFGVICLEKFVQRFCCLPFSLKFGGHRDVTVLGATVVDGSRGRRSSVVGLGGFVVWLVQIGRLDGGF